MSRFHMFASLFLIIALAGCSDDDNTTTKDQGVTTDSAVADQGASSDAASGEGLLIPDIWTSDFPASGYTCGQISACADKCGAACPAGATKIVCVTKCSTDCKALGCTKGKTAYDLLYGCIAGKCALACLGGPDVKCKTCILTKCTAPNVACAASTC